MECLRGIHFGWSDNILKTNSSSLICLSLLIMSAACQPVPAKSRIEISAEVCGQDFVLPGDALTVIKLIDTDRRGFGAQALKNLDLRFEGQSSDLKASSKGCVAIPRRFVGKKSDISIDNVSRLLPADYLQAQSGSQGMLVQLLPRVYIDMELVCSDQTIYSTQNLNDLHKALVASSQDESELQFTYDFHQDGSPNFSLQLSGIF